MYGAHRPLPNKVVWNRKKIMSEKNNFNVNLGIYFLKYLIVDQIDGLTAIYNEQEYMYTMY